MTTTLRLPRTREKKKSSMRLPVQFHFDFEWHKPTYVWITTAVWSAVFLAVFVAFIGLAFKHKVYLGFAIPPVAAALLSWGIVTFVYGLLALVNRRSRSHTVAMNSIILGCLVLWGIIALAVGSWHNMGPALKLIGELKAHLRNPANGYSGSSPDGYEIEHVSDIAAHAFINLLSLQVASLILGWWLVFNLCVNFYVMLNVKTAWSTPLVDHYRPPTKEPLASQVESAEGAV